MPYRVNYGIYRGKEHKNGHFYTNTTWEGSALILAEIRRRNPGWSIVGYAKAEGWSWT